jgi:Fe-S oxidoreductase
MAQIPDMIDDVYACIQCGYCNSVCPTFEEFKWESASPRGKIYLLKRFMSQNILEKIFKKNEEFKRGFVKSLFICASCGACNGICPVHIDLSHRWEELKEWLFLEGFAPMPQHTPLLERVETHKNPFNEPVFKRDKWLPGDVELSSDPEVLYFVGCTESYRRQEIAKATAEILKKANVKFTLLGNAEVCCGSPLLRTGQTTVVKEELIPQNVENIKDTGVKTVITACSGCFQTLTNDYPSVVGPLPFEVLHISQFINRLKDEDRIRFEKKIERKVTYHDPCHLGRHSGVFDEPRKLLTSIPGIDFVEMFRNRNGSRCCGAGGGFKIAFNDKAVTIASKRVKEAVEIGSRQIVTTCPFCKTNLLHGSDMIEGGLDTIDLMELVLEAL